MLVGAGAHTSVLRPLWVLTRDRGAAVEEVACDDVLRWDLDDLERRLSRGPALVVVTHGSNVTGAVQDLQAITRLAHASGGRVLADGAQTVGAIPLDVSALEVDALAFSGHKALLGPPGTGALYLRPGLEVPPLLCGGTGTSSEQEEPPRDMPAKYLRALLLVGLVAILGGCAAIPAVDRTEIDRLAFAITQLGPDVDPEDHRKEFPAGGAHRRGPDPVLVLLVMLLLLTLGLFIGGWTGYPYGFLVLSLLIAGRVIQRKRRPDSRP